MIPFGDVSMRGALGEETEERMKRKRKWPEALAWLTATMTLSACTSYDFGQKSPNTSDTTGTSKPAWISEINGGDAYLRISAEAIKGKDYRDADPCSGVSVPRYFTRKEDATIVVGMSATDTEKLTGALPIVLIGRSDNDSSCKELLSSRKISPAVLVPSSAILSSQDLRIVAKIVNNSNDEIKVGTIVQDSLAVASAVATGGTTATFLASAAAVAKGGGTSAAQQEADALTKSSKVYSQEIAISANGIKAGILSWRIPIVQKSSAPWGNDLVFAEAIISIEPVRSVFETLIDKTSPQLKFLESSPYEYLSIPVFDPAPTTYEIPTTSTPAEIAAAAKNGYRTSLRTYITAHYPGGGKEYVADTKFLSEPDDKLSLDDKKAQMTKFCTNLREQVLGDTGLALTPKDRLMVQWALMSSSAQFYARKGVFSPDFDNNPCFEATSFDILRNLLPTGTWPART
jgi:hypothetical protein